MDISKKLLTLLAIFCVIASAGAACAADAYSDSGYDVIGQADDGSGYDMVGQADDGSGWAGSQYNEDEQGGWAGSQYNEDEQGGWAGSQYNEDEQGGWAGSQYNEDEQGGWAGSQYNEDEQGGWAGSQYNETLENAAGEPANVTDADTVSQNMTAGATSSHTMLETGNPILALFAVSAVLGGYTVLRKK